MTEKEQFLKWFDDANSYELTHDYGRGCWDGWEACAEQKDKEIEWLKECVTVSNNDTKYFRDKLEVALTEVEALHDRLAVVIGQRDEERLAR